MKRVSSPIQEWSGQEVWEVGWGLEWGLVVVMEGWIEENPVRDWWGLSWGSRMNCWGARVAGTGQW
jgi:hypothetical protein